LALVPLPPAAQATTPPLLIVVGVMGRKVEDRMVARPDDGKWGDLASSSVTGLPPLLLLLLPLLLLLLLLLLLAAAASFPYLPLLIVR